MTRGRTLSVCGGVLFILIAIASGYKDPDSGPFCETGNPRGGILCCTGRKDNCSMPRGYGIMETICYCDDFCLKDRRAGDADCCPDYRSVCRGEIRRPPPPPPRCYFNKSFYDAGTKFYDNCKICDCIDMGNRMEVMCTQSDCLVDEELIKRVNRERRGWRAGNVTNFWGRTREEGYNGMLGTSYSRREVRKMKPISLYGKTHNFKRFFDWREFGYVSAIPDQGFCNASWSFGIVSTMTDRVWKWTKGAERDQLSYQQLRNCVRRQKTHPCNSGYLTKSWRYLLDKGLVKEGCYPESLSSRCEITERRLASKSFTRCPNGGMSRLYKTSVVSRIEGEKDIMKELMNLGPVLATMRVFPDFFVYKEGIYDCPPVNPKSGRLHTVKIVGWGEQHIPGVTGPVPYWIVANSWGTSWGEDGFFRIHRGKMACDIEEFVLSFYINLGGKETSRRFPYYFGQA